MSEFKTNKISPRKGTTTTIGDSGDSVSTSGGSTITNAGSISTAGITGGTINNTTGEIYLRGEVDWKPGDIKTASFTATDNQGFFVNTTSGQITVTLPASPSAGDVVGIKDYANTFDTNKCILNANGNKIQGSTELFDVTVEGSSIIIIYVDATQGWVITDASKAADISQQALFITATGGTETTCGDFKIHTFTGPGTFCVSGIANPIGGPNAVDYLVVAGGGGGDNGNSNRAAAGGGGAGGYRTSFPSCNAGSIPVTVQGYSITVGGGGAGGSAVNGNDSIFATITSAGGGYGFGGDNLPTPAGGPGGGDGGSGGGGDYAPNGTAGSGNTPPVSPPQGNPGGIGNCAPTPAGPNSVYPAGGGGGAGAAGGDGPDSNSPVIGGAGGVGLPNSITGSAVFYAGGGGGGVSRAANDTHPAPDPTGTAGPGGNGGGGNGSTGGTGTDAVAGSANTGGGGGGGAAGNQPSPLKLGGSGGSGIVIIRYKYQ